MSAAPISVNEQSAGVPRLSEVPGALRSAAFIALFFCLGVFINSFTSLPLSFLLKERLQLSAEQLAWFSAVSNWAWYIKPAFGLLTDRLPLWGSRRRSYLFLMGSLLTGVWCSLALAPAYRYGPLLLALGLSAMALAFMNTVTAGLLAELSRISGSSGRLNSLRQFSTQAAILAAGPTGGWAAQHWQFQSVAGIAAGVALVLLAGAIFLVREPRSTTTAVPAIRKSEQEQEEEQEQDGGGKGTHPLLVALHSRGVWLAFGFILLVELAPGFDTPLLYYQRDVLGFEKSLFGHIHLAGAVAGILAALAYVRLCQRRSMRITLPLILVLHAVTTLAWLWLASPTSAIVIKVVTGLPLALSNLVIFDLATRAAPRGVESTVLALLFSAINIALQLSNVIGSALYDRHWSLHSLVWLNAGFSALAILLVPLLPAALIAGRDGERGEAG